MFGNGNAVCTGIRCPDVGKGREVAGGLSEERLGLPSSKHSRFLLAKMVVPLGKQS